MDQQLIVAAVAGAIVLLRVPWPKRLVYGGGMLLFWSAVAGAFAGAIYAAVRLVHWAWVTPAW